MTNDPTLSVIEALIFSSEHPVTIEQMKKALDNTDGAQVRSLIEALKAQYEDARRGIRLVEVAGGFQMVTAAECAPFLKKLYRQRRVERLSRPALETLAIIAYKQPVTKMEIESLRSVNVDGMMATLVEKGLIRIAGRKKAPGSPYVYGTTKGFLEHFGLNSLEELPKIENFTNLAESVEASQGIDSGTTVEQLPAGEESLPAGS